MNILISDCVNECTFEKDLVCGDDEIEYRNECWLKYTACANGVEIKVHHKGPCSEDNDVPLEDKGYFYTKTIIILKTDNNIIDSANGQFSYLSFNCSLLKGL